MTTTQAPRTTHPKVFLSFAMGDRSLADRVLRALSGAGIDVVWTDSVAPDGQYDDAVRDALHESSAVVVVLSDVASGEDISANVLFEIGAAAGAGKPIYVVLERMTDRLPFNVPHLQILPLNRVDEIAKHLGA